MIEPFMVTGIDFTGALYIKHQKRRRRHVFACLHVPVLVLSMVMDLSEETFSSILKQEILTQILVSDNASTFMLTVDDLKALFKSTGACTGRRV